MDEACHRYRTAVRDGSSHRPCRFSPLLLNDIAKAARRDDDVVRFGKCARERCVAALIKKLDCFVVRLNARALSPACIRSNATAKNRYDRLQPAIVARRLRERGGGCDCSQRSGYADRLDHLVCRDWNLLADFDWALRLKWDGAAARRKGPYRSAYKFGIGGTLLSLCDDPTGKSLPIYRIHVKPLAKKYFCFPEMKIGLHVSPSRPIQRGIARGHQCGTGMRWTRRALFDQGA